MFRKLKNYIEKKLEIIISFFLSYLTVFHSILNRKNTFILIFLVNIYYYINYLIIIIKIVY